MVQPPRREFASAVPKARARQAAVPASATFTEVRIRPCLSPQHLQLEACTLHPTKLKGQSRRSCRVTLPFCRLMKFAVRRTETSSHSSDSTAIRDLGAHPALRRTDVTLPDRQSITPPRWTQPRFPPRPGPGARQRQRQHQPARGVRRISDTPELIAWIGRRENAIDPDHSRACGRVLRRC